MRNPGWAVVLLNERNHVMFTGGLDVRTLKFSQTPQQRADYVRLCVLADHGGVYIDGSVLLMTSFEWINVIFETQPEIDFVGYMLRSNTKLPEIPVIENWFFACKPKSPFVQAWRDEFLAMNEFASIKEYISESTKAGVDLQGIAHAASYLTMHVACLRIQTLRGMGNLCSTFLMAGEEGPWSYLVDAGLDDPSEECWLRTAKIAADRLWEGKPRPCYATPLIKLCNHQRSALQKHADDKPYEVVVERLLQLSPYHRQRPRRRKIVRHLGATVSSPWP